MYVAFVLNMQNNSYLRSLIIHVLVAKRFTVNNYFKKFRHNFYVDILYHTNVHRVTLYDERFGQLISWYACFPLSINTTTTCTIQIWQQSKILYIRKLLTNTKYYMVAQLFVGMYKPVISDMTLSAPYLSSVPIKSEAVLVLFCGAANAVVKSPNDATAKIHKISKKYMLFKKVKSLLNI